MQRSVILLAVLATLACGSTGQADGGELTAEAPLAASVEVQVTSAEVKMLLHVTNSGDGPVAFTFPTSQRHDFVVRTPAGSEVWRWSEGRAFAQVVTRDTLAPGESWALEAVWTPEADRTGVYRATGLLTAMDREVRQSTQLRLP